MPHHSWRTAEPTYREKEIKIMAGWIASGVNGSVVGLPGCGRANFLNFLCHRPEIVQQHLPMLDDAARSIVLIPVDLNTLPANNLATLYRVILRAFFRLKERFVASLQKEIGQLYQKNEAIRDPFLPQSGLQELLLSLQAEAVQTVLVINRFDRFCNIATLPMVNTLKGLRDEFKETLTVIAGMPQQVAYLPAAERLGPMYELLDNYICWIGAMSEGDAQTMIKQETQFAPKPPNAKDVEKMLKLSGGYPALLKAICHWWLTTDPRPVYGQWTEELLAQNSITYRLDKLWAGITKEEQFVLSELQRGSKATIQRSEQILTLLADKGVCRPNKKGWAINGDLLTTYMGQVEAQGQGRIWLEEKTERLFQGQTLIQGLTDLERSVLIFLTNQPYVRHAKTDLIFNTWPDELRQEGVSDNSLYQIIFGIRQKVEAQPSDPAYILNWRGKPEGGYMFFPEGRPK